MCLALDPTVGTDWNKHYVDVETQSGMTVVDRLNVAEDKKNRAIWAPVIKGRKVKICWRIDNQRWKEALYAALR